MAVYRVADNLDELLTVEVVTEATGARARRCSCVWYGAVCLKPRSARAAKLYCRAGPSFICGVGSGCAATSAVNFAGAAVILDLIAQLT